MAPPKLGEAIAYRLYCLSHLHIMEITAHFIEGC